MEGLAGGAMGGAAGGAAGAAGTGAATGAAGSAATGAGAGMGQIAGAAAQNAGGAGAAGAGGGGFNLTNLMNGYKDLQQQSAGYGVKNDKYNPNPNVWDGSSAPQMGSFGQGNKSRIPLAYQMMSMPQMQMQF